ncbi:hypothetical protein [Streptomyces subrutilus]|uniref:hypothetical protein n=1 Tax=Streptomyces subrutilus TaxID=36818 RepID=UPI002E0E1B1C|nr:hypothetical protein OG479_13675 [Streptomyces subrutilus]
MDRLLRTVGRCALAFLLALGALALLPRAVRDAVPRTVIGGAVIVLVALVGGRWTPGRSR